MFPKWMFHETAGKRLFADPAQLAAAAPGWCETPTEVGLVPEAPPMLGGMIFSRGVEQPVDATVASDQEIDEIAGRAAGRRPVAPVVPQPPDHVRRAGAKRA